MPADAYRLPPDRLRRACSVTHFKFQTTEELPFSSDIIGQPRGVRAIEFGVDIESRGYNIYVLGPTGTGRTTAIKHFLQQCAAAGEVPKDWVYVHNFEESHKPRALDLPPGEGTRLQDDMEAFVENLRRDIPRALDTEEFQEAMNTIGGNLQEQREAIMGGLQNQAAEKEFAIVRAPSGLMVVPVAEGQPMSGIEDLVRPGVSRGTMKALTPLAPASGSVLANTTPTLACMPQLTEVFSPFST